MRNYLVFLWRCGRLAFVGDWRYYTWVGVLSLFCLLGINAYAKQFAYGLVVTGMSDQVSWGVYCQLHLPGRRRGGGGDDGDTGLYLQQRGTP